MKPLSLYIHWPFCQSLCPYCHFNRVVATTINHTLWITLLSREMAYWAQTLEPRFLQSIFFGGGTPSLMEPWGVKSLVDQAYEYWPPQEACEVTLEINPNESKKILDFSEAGINRFSMGVQSFQQEALTTLGRSHTLDHLYSALTTLKDSGLSYSFDLIYGHIHHIQHNAWQKELEQALLWINGHLSTYHLSYEIGTPFYKKRHESLKDDLILSLEAETERMLLSQGLERYEICNYAIPGKESLHNLIYWEYGDYIGIGPGAHGRITLSQQKKATETYGSLERWKEQVAATGHGLARCDSLSPSDELCEKLLMGLRLKKGLPLERLGYLSPAFLARLEECRRYNLIIKEKEELRLTLQGRSVLNSIVMYLTS